MARVKPSENISHPNEKRRESITRRLAEVGHGFALTFLSDMQLTARYEGRSGNSKPPPEVADVPATSEPGMKPPRVDKKLVPEGLKQYLDSLGEAPQLTPTEQVIRGYKVRTKQQPIDPKEAMSRRKAIAEVIARSLSKQRDK